MEHRFNFAFAELGNLGDKFRVGDWPFQKDQRKKLKDAIYAMMKSGQTTQIDFDRQDWWTYLRDFGFSKKDLLRRDLMDSTDFGESIRHSGAYSGASEYYGSGSNSTDEMDKRIVGRNSRLLNALAERVGLNSIHTSTEAKRIEQKDGWVTVHAADNRTDQFAPPHPKNKSAQQKLPTRAQTFKARYCICTVPARVLTSIDFVPKLSDSHRSAANDLQYARIMKTVLLFRNRFWEKSMGPKFSCFTDNTSDFSSAASLGQPGEQGILCSYAIGDKADDLAARGTMELRALIAAELSELFPGEDTLPIAVERYAWQDDEYTQGVYAFYRPGQWFPIRKALGTPHKSVYFAGEHLADEQGFMDGAVDSGQDAARAIVASSKET
jgi:monoamine oxidase